ncbi:MAG TPA: hypothetical protein VIY28_15255 [Pseudonocardiaceae bacterium]
MSPPLTPTWPSCARLALLLRHTETAGEDLLSVAAAAGDEQAEQLAANLVPHDTGERAAARCPATAGVASAYHENRAEIMTYRNTLRRIQVHARTPQETRTLLVRRIEEST